MNRWRVGAALLSAGGDGERASDEGARQDECDYCAYIGFDSAVNREISLMRAGCKESGALRRSETEQPGGGSVAGANQARSLTGMTEFFSAAPIVSGRSGPSERRSRRGTP